jgi:integrase
MAIDKKDFMNKVKTNLYANKDYTKFLYDFTLNSKRHRGIIDLSERIGWNKRDKITVAEAEFINIKNAKKDSDINLNITLDNFMKKHFEHLPQNNWKRTKVSHYERYISPYIGSKKIVAIKQMHIKDVIKIQEDMKLAPRTVKQTLEILNPAFKEAIANRLISFNPCYEIKVKLPKTKKIVSNATSELKTIYVAIKKVFKDDPLFQALYLFALQGRRKSEILNIKKDDISFEHSYYIIRDTKNGSTQKMYLSDEIKELIEKFIDFEGEFLFTNPATKKRFVNIEKQTVRLKNALDNRAFSLHYLRNVISSAMSEQGIDAVYQSGALGHSDLTTINKYSSLDYLKSSQIASNIISEIFGKSE